MMHMVNRFNMSYAPLGWGKDGRLELDTNHSEDNIPHRIGTWNRSRFILDDDFDVSFMDGWWTDSKLRSRYGNAPAKLVSVLEERRRNISRLYEPPIFPFKNYSQAIDQSGLQPPLSQDLETYLAGMGLDDAFVREVVEAYTQSTYGDAARYSAGVDHMRTHAHAGLSSIDNQGSQQGAIERSEDDESTFLPTVESSIIMNLLDRGPDLWSPHEFEGPWSEVSTVGQGSNKSWMFLIYDWWQVSKEPTFDEVILAAPYWNSEIAFEPLIPMVPCQQYEPLWSTVLTTPLLLSPKYFGLAADAPIPDEILTTPRVAEGPPSTNRKANDFHRIIRRGTLFSEPSNYTTRENMYEISSAGRIDVEVLSRLFDIPANGNFPCYPRVLDPETWEYRGLNVSCEDISWLTMATWDGNKAYPVFEPFASGEELDRLAPIKLMDGLWYTSGMELIDSRKEAMMLSGKNVARLMVDEWLGK